MHKKFPRLVYASISGYGQTGPRRDEAGYDAVMQAEGGLMSVTGDPDRPGLSARRGDHRHGRRPVLRAGHHRRAARARAIRARSTRRHRHARYDGGAAHLPGRNWFANGKIPPRQGNRHATIAPYETFTTKDGDIVIAVGNDRPGRNSARRSVYRSSPAIHVSRPTGIAWSTTTRCVRRSTRSFRTKTNAEWIAILNDAGVANGEVREHRADAERSATGRARHDRDADASDRGRHESDRRADQVVGECGDAFARRRQYRDSTPTRCWLRSVTTRRRSPRCAKNGSSDNDRFQRFQGFQDVVLAGFQRFERTELLERQQNDAFGTVEPLEPLEPCFMRARAAALRAASRRHRLRSAARADCCP